MRLSQAATNLLERLLKAVVSKTWTILPGRARRAILDQLAKNMHVQERFAMMAAIAPKIGITAFKAKGQYGEIESSSGDLFVFPNYALAGFYDRHSDELISSFFANEKHGTFVDIGANIGLATLPVAKNANVQCICFEPEPVNFTHLAANVSTNCPHGNVTIKQLALFDRASVIDFEIAEGNIGDHRIHVSNEPGQQNEQERRVIKVDAMPLDEAVGAITGPLAVKIDTQGAEPFVVRGGRRVLEQAGLLMIEFWPYGSARLNGDLHVVIDFLEKTFAKISIIHGEIKADEELPEPLPATDGCNRLRAMMSPARDDASEYWNIIAYK